jgi:hypothetical protein
MLYKKLEKLSAANFKRYCGVERATFDKMCDIVRRQSSARKLVEGRPSKLVIEDQVLLTLEYWREYRTMFHLGTSWGISESAVSRIIARVEDILTDSKEFALPGKRSADWSPDVEIVVVDVAESPIERPSKKNKSDIIRARKSGIR